jgi:hypothetical protein
MSARHHEDIDAAQAVSSLHLDVSGTVDVTNPQAVGQAVEHIYRKRFPLADHAILGTFFRDFARLYRGEYPGFLACETPYHDIHHVLDVTLAAARLIDGYESDAALDHHDSQPIGVELAHLGIVLALFHDAGYIRRKGDVRHRHGAEYTRTHVSRSAKFLEGYLPTIGRAEWAPLAGKLVHFTGYEISPEAIPVKNPQHRLLGMMIGTADVIAQMADRDYLRKCRDYLYQEFEMGGMTRVQDRWGAETVIYASAEHLLEKTPGFISHAINERLGKQFGGLYQCLAKHSAFNGRNLYLDAINHNRQHLEQLLVKSDHQSLKSDNLRAL